MDGLIETYKSGTEIEIKLNKQKALIISCKIEVNNIIYQVSYFTNEGPKDVDLYDFEFDVTKDAGTNTIGFK